MRSIEIHDTTLSDSTHALRKAPLPAKEILPLAEAMDAVGFHSAEVWGGATFDACLRYLNEDPWDRLRILSQKMSHTPLRIIVRGQNLLGYRPMSLDVTNAFAREAARNGIRVARVFDSLNDIPNLEFVISAFIDAGVEPQGAIIYTQSPVHSVERFAMDAKHLVDLGCRSVCINDIAGILTPSVARSLVHAISGFAPVCIHSRSITGMGAVSYIAAIEAGAVGIDCTIAPFSIAAAQPTSEAMLEAIADMHVETSIDRKALKAYSKMAEQIAVRHSIGLDEQQLFQSMISVHKIPIGMLTGLISELRGINALGRLSDILAEVTRVREDFGWPPLITPISQMVSAQAIQNVIFGKRYSVMSREVHDYLRGMYGTPPGEVNPDLLKGVTQMTGRSSALLPDRLEACEAELKKEGLFQKSEDIITYALFGQLALSFFRHRKDPQIPRKAVVSNVDSRLELLTAFMDRRAVRKLELSGKDFHVRLVKRSAPTPSAAARSPVPGEPSEFEMEEMTVESSEPESKLACVAPLSGTFYRSSGPGQPPFVDVGSEVSEETVIGLVEAMKLFHEVKAEQKGVVRSFAVESGGMVEQGGAIVYLDPAA
ncbi:MAG: pyruvate carboxylase subunit B [Candidatus Hydrogenedentota bacterium]